MTLGRQNWGNIVTLDSIESDALLQGVSINQFALYSFTKELAELENSSYLKNIGRKKPRKIYLTALTGP